MQIRIIQQSYRYNFFHAYEKSKPRRKSPGSVFKPLTWKPRWKMQATLFAICCGFPWVIGFHHSQIPGFDKLLERVVMHLWHWEDKDGRDTFASLPPVKTMYDRELEKFRDRYESDDDNSENVPHMEPKDFAGEIEGGLPIIRNQQ